MLSAFLLATVLILTWVDNSEDEDGFSVYRSINYAPMEHIANVPANLSTFSEDIARTNYAQQICYEVDAFNENGLSARSNMACKTLPACRQKGGSGRCR
jgi:hypothetical protein